MLTIETTLEQLQSQITSNYEVAKTYYKQRRENLNLLFTKDAMNATESVIDYINSKIDDFQEQVSKVVYRSLDTTNGWNYAVGATAREALADETLDISAKNVIQALMGGKAKDRRHVQAALGNEFEKFIERALMPEALEGALSSVALAAIGDSLSGFKQTGQAQSRAWNVSGIKNIRPDIGLNMNMDITMDDGILRLIDAANSGLAVEFQELFDLDQFLPTTLNSSDVIQAYLSSNAYGFSMKVWKEENSNGKEFTQSAPIKDLLNSIFDETRPKTWESNYANTYGVYQISRMLMNFIGPMNVAMILGNRYVWMDDFISTRLFYMDTQLRSFKKSSKRGDGWEGHPVAPNAAIKIKVLNNDVHQFSTGFRGGKLFIRNRRLS